MRDKALDIGKGICILFMVLGHCPWPESTIWHKAIESFHMPFFFLVAGFLFRPTEMKTLFVKSAKRLLLPLTIGAFVCALISWLMHNPNFSLTYLKAFAFPGGTRGKVFFLANWPDMGVFWFLAALFWCRCIYNRLNAIISKHQLIVPVCLLISTFAAVVFRRIPIPFGIAEGCCGLIFYSIGNWAKEQNINDKHIPWFAYLIFLILWFVEIHFVSFAMYKCGYDYFYWIGIVFACGMGFCIYKISQVVSKTAGGSIFSKTGKYSLEIMACHEAARIVVRSINCLTSEPLSNVCYSVMLFGLTLTISTLYILIKNYVQTPLYRKK